MSFIHPSYLWALLGLLVPIAIHLWSKKEAKTIKVGSVQLLSESKSKQLSSIQLNELWLLLLRVLIVGVLSLVLANPRWHSNIENTTLTYLVEPELSRNNDFMAKLVSLKEGQEIRLFKKGFPIWDNDSNNEPRFEVPDYWALASETDLLKTDSIVVFTKGLVKGIRGSRPETNHQINWLIIDSLQTVEKPLIAYQNVKNVQLFSAVSTANTLEVNRKIISLGPEYVFNSEGDSLMISDKEIIAKVPMVIQKPIDISIVYSDSLTKDKRYFEAAFATLAHYLDRDLNVVSMLDTIRPKKEQTDVLIWLSEKPISSKHQKLLVFKKDSVANTFIEKGSESNTYVLTKRINAENAIEQRLVENLMDILDINYELEELLAKADNRQVSETELQTNFNPSTTKKTQLGSFELLPYLWVLLFALLIVERLVAYIRTQ